MTSAARLGQGLTEPKSKLWIYAAAAFHIGCAIVLVPITSHPYDLAVLTSNAQAWLNWGFSPFYNWKFGSDLAALAFLAQAFRASLAALGVPGIVALHIAWKLPLIAADLLTAGTIFRLAMKLNPGRASTLSALWLVNPVVLWVSAGHGQVESLAILCTLAALDLGLDGRLFAAGVVTGLGIGLEYFPLAVLGSVLIWWRGGHLSGRRPFAKYVLGLLISVALCYLPLAYDPTARAALVGGLTSSSGLSAGSVNSALAIWSWFDYRLEGIWPLLFLIGGIVALGFSLRLARRGPAVGITFLSVVLLMALLLDANTLPQFAPIAAAALWLLAMSVPVHPATLVMAPAAGLASYFFFLDSGTSTANAFFYDDWYATGVSLWHVPVSERAAVFLGHVFSLGLLAAFAYAVVGWVRPGKWSWAAAHALSGGLCAVLVIWALQPALWSSAFAAAPDTNLPDFDYAAASRSGTIDSIGPDVFRVTYSESLLEAARKASTRPAPALRLTLGDIYDRVGADRAMRVDEWPDRGLSLPNWTKLQSSVQFMWVRLWLGSHAWSPASQPDLSSLRLDLSGTSVTPARSTIVSAQEHGIGWALVDFRVPAGAVDSSGHLVLLPRPSSLLWNGSPSGPWIRVSPAAGNVRALVQAKIMNASYEVNPDGQGYLEGLPAEGNFVIDLSAVQLDSFRVDAAVLRWPDSPEAWKHDRSIQALGACFCLLLLLATAFTLSRQLSSVARLRSPAPRVPLEKPEGTT